MGAGAIDDRTDILAGALAGEKTAQAIGEALADRRIAGRKRGQGRVMVELRLSGGGAHGQTAGFHRAAHVLGVVAQRLEGGGHRLEGIDPRIRAEIAQPQAKQADIGADIEIDSVLGQIEPVLGEIVGHDLVPAETDLVGVYAMDLPPVGKHCRRTTHGRMSLSLKPIRRSLSLHRQFGGTDVRRQS